MPPQTITIEMNRTVDVKNPASRWVTGSRYETDAAELKRRQVPDGSYKVIGKPKGESTTTGVANGDAGTQTTK